MMFSSCLCELGQKGLSQAKFHFLRQVFNRWYLELMSSAQGAAAEVTAMDASKTVHP